MPRSLALAMLLSHGFSRMNTDEKNLISVHPRKSVAELLVQAGMNAGDVRDPKHLSIDLETA